MKARLIHRLLAAIPLALIGTAITLAQHGPPTPQAASPETSTTHVFSASSANVQIQPVAAGPRARY